MIKPRPTSPGRWAGNAIRADGRVCLVVYFDTKGEALPDESTIGTNGSTMIRRGWRTQCLEMLYHQDDGWWTTRPVNCVACLAQGEAVIDPR